MQPDSDVGQHFSRRRVGHTLVPSEVLSLCFRFFQDLPHCLDLGLDADCLQNNCCLLESGTLGFRCPLP